MHYRKQLAIIIVFFTLLLALGVLFGFSGKIGLCINDNVRLIFDISCMDFYDLIAVSLSVVSISIILVAILLLFLHESVYVLWRKFALMATPIGAIIIFTSPVSVYDDSPFFGRGFTRTDATWLVILAFFAFSFLIILRRYINATGNMLVISKRFNHIWKILSVIVNIIVWGSGLISILMGEPFLLGILFSGLVAFPTAILMIIIFILLKKLKNLGLDQTAQKLFLVAIASSFFAGVLLIAAMATFRL